MDENGVKTASVEHVERSKGGRPKGSVNRTTRETRQAVAEFVNSSIPQFARWLGQVAEGIPKVDKNGELLRDHQGSIIYVSKPDPATAMKLVADIAEYHLPKLSRQEVNAVVSHEQVDVSQMSSAEINRRIMEAMGVTFDGEFVEVVPNTVPAVTKGPQEG